MALIEVDAGDSPLVLGLPHTGTEVPPSIFDRLNPTGQRLADTDWHIERLYRGLVSGVTTVRTTVHRYVIDVNRDPGGESLYPGQATTGLCPVVDFEGSSIYRPKSEPTPAEIEDRRREYHQPYHAALLGELERVRQRHGFAVLYDCHSIRSRLPFLFAGTLPDFNIGTDHGATCDATMEQLVADHCLRSGHSMIVNGRFRGGWTTRHYGRPDTGWHAIQMELAQSIYIQESPPWTWQSERADAIRDILKTLLEALIQWRPR